MAFRYNNLNGLKDMTQYFTQIIMIPVLDFWNHLGELRKKNMSSAGRYHVLHITFPLDCLTESSCPQTNPRVLSFKVQSH